MLGQLEQPINISGRPAIHLPYASPRWAPLLFAYMGYAVVTLVGSVVGISLQVVGASLFILFIAVKYGRLILPLRKNWLTLGLVLCFLAPLVAPLLGAATVDADSVSYVVKYYATYFLILLCLSLRLPPLYTSKLRLQLFMVILLLLVAGMLLSHAGMGDTERIKGLFTNPNNFALMAMGLLFLLDEERDNAIVRWCAYGLVGGLILLSGTAGAMLSFAAAFCYRSFAAGKGRQLLLVGLAVVCLAGLALTAATMFRNSPALKSGPVGKLVAKVDIARDNLSLVFSNKAVNFIAASHGYSEDSTSALWRIMHWKDTFQVYLQGGWQRILFGAGLGSSKPIMRILPHNDYLRFLFELGLFGLLATVIVWGAIFRQMLPTNRWLLVMIAIYGISENNFDNFLALTLIVFFSVSARHPINVLGRRTLDAYQQLVARCQELNPRPHLATEGHPPVLPTPIGCK